ncbi:MAG: hypothetical protein ABJC66_12680 [Gammaproteobacteria bacterium]
MQDLAATLDKSRAAGVEILSPKFETAHLGTAIIEFPGGYIAEIHSNTVR